MTAGAHSVETGLLSPVVFSGTALLLVLAPLYRAGNRGAALMVLELLAIALLALLVVQTVDRQPAIAATPARWPLAVLCVTPLLIVLWQLVPLPAAWTFAGPTRALYRDAALAAGVSVSGWRPMSLVPTATAASAMAAIPVLAAFIAGRLATSRQLRLMFMLVIAMCAGQVVLSVLQAAQGADSPLQFGLNSDRPVGTFANSNHLANYLCLGLAAMACVASERDRHLRHSKGWGIFHASSEVSFWLSAILLFTLGVLLTRSRGALLFALPFGLAAFMAVGLRSIGWRRSRLLLPALLLTVTAAVGVLGLELTTSRASATEFTSSAMFRSTLARSSLGAAIDFLPWGAGWGSYEAVYQRFQPESIFGMANHAHMDYVELLLEGGALFIVLAGCFVWLAQHRARELLREYRDDGKLGRESMLALISGIGLAGFLLHSLVDFNMRIPANAILAALLAGVFLRPLPGANQQ